MRYYITGANGFIGKHMVKYLEDKGHEVIPLNQWEWKYSEEPYEFIHLAAYGNHYFQKEYDKILDANILWLSHILYLLENSAVVKFYNISTSSIQLPVDTLYSVSKRFGELMVESYNDPRFVNIRPYSVYGPGEADHRFIPTVIRALHSGEWIQLDGEAVHDWIYIDDFIKAMFEGHTMIGTGESYSNLDIVFALQEIAKETLTFTLNKLRDYDSKDWVCAKGVPHRSIYQGLKQTYEWFTQKDLNEKRQNS